MALEKFKERSGYEWIDTGYASGFWRKLKNKGGNSNRLPIFCPHKECSRITGTVDDKYLVEYGFCSICYVQYVEGRKVPLIDLEKYKPQPIS